MPPQKVEQEEVDQEEVPREEEVMKVANACIKELTRLAPEKQKDCLAILLIACGQSDAASYL